MPQAPYSIPNLLGGVSRQSVEARQSTQSEVLENVILPIGVGCTTRPGYTLIKSPDTSDGSLNLTIDDVDNFFIHWIDRDVSNRFVLFVDTANTGNEIQAVNIAGADVTVNALPAAMVTYLAGGSGSSKDKLKAITVADGTFLVNTRVNTAFSGAFPDLVNDADYIQNPGWGNEGYSDLFFSASGEAKDNFGGGPPNFVTGKFTQVGLDEPGWPAGFYEATNRDVNGDPDYTAGPPFWIRILSNDANYNFSSMPYQLTYNGVSFTGTTSPYKDRLTGDQETNPGPSFIGSPISDISFFNDRFVYGSGETLFLSALGDFFNLWLDNYKDVTLDDPIDITASTNNINIIQHLVPLPNRLVVFTTGNTQFEFQFTTSDVPPNARITPLNSVEVTDVKPVVLGTRVYYLTNRTGYTSVGMFNFVDNFNTFPSVDVSSHIPEYLPADIVKMEEAHADHKLFLMSNTERNALYVYETYTNGQEILQSSWYKWTFDESIRILSYHVYSNRLYFVFEQNSKIWMAWMYVSIPSPDVDGAGTMPFHISMDHKYYATGGVYDSTTDKTTFSLPFKDATLNLAVLASNNNRAGAIVTSSNDSTGSTTDIIVNGNINTGVWVGRSFSQIVELSPPVLKTQNNVAVSGTYVLRQLKVFHKNASNYNVEIIPYGRSPIVCNFNANTLGNNTALLGKLVIDKYGEYIVSVLGDAKDTVVRIKNSNVVPFTIVGVNFTGTYTGRESIARD